MTESKVPSVYGICNEDLRKEREKCTFDTVELTHLLDGGPEKTKARKDLGEYCTLLFI